MTIADLAVARTIPVMTKPQRRPADISAEVAAQLMWGEKTASEVLQAVAPESHDAQKVLKYIDAFKANGCVYISSYSKRGIKRFAWNSKPFEHEDATKDQVR